jgi:2-polyprenyl-3-methyl-5-hydroxy-6-metoxy-1,4-benzoquinol methylase
MFRNYIARFLRKAGVETPFSFERYYVQFSRRFQKKIDTILSIDERAAGLPEDPLQWEYAVPGVRQFRQSGYYRSMLGRYLFAVPCVKGKRVLDAGCGLGWGAYLISDLPARLVAIDANEGALAFARAAWPAANIDFRKCPVTGLKDLGERFDCILGFELLEHLRPDQAQQFLSQAFEVLLPQGRIIASSYFPATVDPGRAAAPSTTFHVHEFSREEVARMAEKAGFRRTVFHGESLAVIRK